MKKFAIILPLILLLTCCGTIKKVPITEKIIYRQIDSITWHDSTIYHHIPVEKIVDIVPTYDTLRLETSIAKSEAYIDTLTHSLKGSLENKKDSIKTIIKWKEKIIIKDSLITKEVPVEVIKEVKYVPTWAWISLIVNIIVGLFIVFKLYLKFKI